ncbi:DUF2147 domain-containing protein [Qipengyuania sp. SS22]|uniref:DUF2147 domain-containing protein n=1 Tax=Qipengyuania sp. SS22 TaxID=2979461 RepID=UPI0021E62470|nr:DUF2147 domain-containing protein [Qipengyuania sp. SS22]UYH54735.1 DUF2147 domain-containing protein [Qipengyuania sp. SS22]
MKRWLACAAMALIATPLAAAEPIEGRWVTADKDAVVQIGNCGRSTCGRIAKFLVTPPQGADQRDVNNRDAAKRSRKLLGMAILTGFTKDEDAWRGEIYDPNNGKTYRSIVRRSGPDRLEVKGCIGPFCQTQIWQRAR